MNKRRNYIICLLLFLSSFIQHPLFSQTITVTPDRYKIFIGEQIKIKLAVEKVWTGVPWLYVPDSVNHLEVVDRGKIDTVQRGGSVNYYQTITITSFDSGTWKFPSLVLRGVSKTTIPFNIAVLPVDVSHLKDYNDIKDIILVKPGINWLLIIIIALIVLLIAALLWWYIRKRRKRVVKTPAVTGKSPLQWAMEELDRLRQLQVDSPSATKHYYSELTRISRTFFAMQVNQQAFHKTTDEWMINLQPLQVDNETKTQFFQVLRLADTVKFAKYLPPAGEMASSVDITKQMLQKVSMLDSKIYSKYQPQ